MNWKHLFGKMALETGKQYYKRGRVQDFAQNGNHFSASVIGSVVYDVEATVDGNKAPIMTCGCSEAEKGEYCTHMAALLYAIDERLPKSNTAGKKQTTKRKTLQGLLDEGQIQMGMKKPQEKRVFPFKEKDYPRDEYRYFAMCRMTQDLVFYEEICQQAQELIARGEARLQNVDILNTDDEEAGMAGCANGMVIHRSVEWNVRINFSRKRIERAVCYIPGCYRNYDSNYRYGDKVPCVHEMAVLFLLDDYLRENNPGDSTDWRGMELLRSFKSRKQHRAGLSGLLQQGKVQLEPRLEETREGFSISFRIGWERLYVVKNLTQLVQDVSDGNTIPLGKKSEIDFAVAEFSEESAKLYEFIRKAVQEERAHWEFSQMALRFLDRKNLEFKAQIPLFGYRLDEFFKLASESQIPISYLCYDRRAGGMKTMQIRCADQIPRIALKIEKDVDEDHTLHGVRLCGKLPDFHRGADNYYYVDEKKQEFCRVDNNGMEELDPLLRLGEDGEIRIRIGRKNLSGFYRSVLPVLRSYAEILEPQDGEVEELLPPQAEYVFYLDADKKDVFCRGMARYGEEELPLSYNLTGEQYRDSEGEEEVREELCAYFPHWDSGRNMYCCDGDENLIYRVLESGVDHLLSLGEVQSTDRFRNLKVRARARVFVGVSVGSELMDLTVSSEDISQEELLEILRGYKKKKKFFRLRNGDFLRMEDDNLEALEAMMEAMHLSAKEFVKGKMQIPIYRALYLDKLLEENEGLYINRDLNFRKLIKDFKTVKESDYEIPKHLEGIMRNYQIYGHKWLRTLESCGFGGILADDMGLGKTLQVISVLAAANQDLPSLVVCPASLVYNWQEEFSRFAPDLRVTVVAGTLESRRSTLASYTRWDVLVTSYDLLKRDIGTYEALHFSYEIIDEAQYIKNHTTAAAKSVKIIKSRTRYALTGTPIENRLSELWSIFDYLMPGFLYGYETFRRELEIPIAKNKDEEATGRLKKMVSPFILRRLKGDVLTDLPEKMEEVRYARLEQKQQQIYDGQVVEMQKMLRSQTDENFKQNKLQVLAELTKIRQICCDPALLLDDYDGGSAKREACMDLIESAIEGEHKILLFSQFTTMLELLETDLQKRGISYYKITGATSKERRLELVRKFNSDSTSMFLISLKAGGTGLNLTGADVVIHYDPWWNVAAQNQATDRAHRIGQTKVVSVYRLIIKDSIEEKILKMQEAKKNLADEILSGDLGGLMGMSREELLELVR